MRISKSVRIIDRFLRRKFKYRFDEKREAFALDIGLGNEVGSMKVVIAVQNDCVNCLATFPFRGTDKTALKLAEFVCRINCHLSVGHLDYDFDDGEIGFAYDLSEGQLKAEKAAALERFFGLAFAMGEKIGPAIAQLAIGKGDPESLYAEIQAGSSAGGIEPNGRIEASGPSPELEPVRCEERNRAEPVVRKVGREECRAEDEIAEESIPVPVRNYSLEGLHVMGDFPLEKIVAASRKYLSVVEKGTDELPDRPGLNILLWGPAGAGKSEFIRYLGQQLRCQVIVKMGSDILGRYAGDTEKSIREAFEEAEDRRAILFLDELDGVMQNRSDATVGWEISQVNELLHRMEHFKGIMIGATNFKDNLDPAVLRRFTFKLEFGYLESNGKRTFFDRAFKTSLTEAEKVRLDNIPNLTPGDFRTVSQSLFYLSDEVDNSTRLAALEREVALKGEGHRVCMGFAAR